jgi:hypothetical protein
MRARRLEIVDEYVEDGRAAVYTTAGMVVLLSALATTAWGLIGEEWVTSAQLAERLVHEFGDPGDPGDRDDKAAERLTEDALRSLAEMSLVELDEDPATARATARATGR